MNKEELNKLAEGLEDAVNCFGDNGMNELAEHMSNKIHRTLNQAFTGSFVINFVRQMASNYKTGNYDARNKTACEMCSLMWEGLKSKYEWLKESEKVDLPMI